MLVFLREPDVTITTSSDVSVSASTAQLQSQHIPTGQPQGPIPIEATDQTPPVSPGAVSQAPGTPFSFGGTPDNRETVANVRTPTTAASRRTFASLNSSRYVMRYRPFEGGG